MQLWRLVASRYLTSALSGEGARRYSGRWHHAGTPVVYCASSRPLAVLELLVHVDPYQAPEQLHFLPLEVSDDRLEQLDLSTLGEGWSDQPARDVTRDLGTAWATEGLSLGLIVPSVVLPSETNVVLNPLHPDMGSVRVGAPEPFRFDRRLLERGDAETPS
ncbi:MAG: RES family NAD+ phosphorylase [Acidobacteriota bacterium]